MKIAIRLSLIIVVALAGRPASLTAQHAGFQIGIARPASGFPPTQPPATVVRGGTFVGNGGFVAGPPGTVVVPGRQFAGPGPHFRQPGRHFVATNQFFVTNQIIVTNPLAVPNQVLVPSQQLLLPGQTVFPQQVYSPAPSIPQVYTPAPTIVIPVVQAPAAHFGPSFQTRPPEPIPGTPRADVIHQFGNPTVSVITSRGEILQFSGGVTVVIQNGQVVRPR